MSKLLFQTTLDAGFLFMKSHCDVQVYDDHMEQQRYRGKKKTMEYCLSYKDALHVKIRKEPELVPGTFIEVTSEPPCTVELRYIYQSPRILPYGIKVDNQSLVDLLWHLCEAIAAYHEPASIAFPSSGDLLLDREMRPFFLRGLVRQMFTVPGLTLYCMADTAYIAFAHDVLDESGTRHVGLELTQEEFVNLMRAPSLATFQQIDRDLTRDRKRSTVIPANLNLRNIFMLKLKRDMTPTLDLELEQELMAPFQK